MFQKSSWVLGAAVTLFAGTAAAEVPRVGWGTEYRAGALGARLAGHGRSSWHRPELIVAPGGIAPWIQSQADQCQAALDEADLVFWWVRR